MKKSPEGVLIPKARLVARGFTQRQGIDYGITYAPVCYNSILRLLFAISSAKRLYIKQFDVKTAFLHGDLEETIFMKQPDGYNDGTNRVWLLNKSLYGLKQAPRVWNQKLSQTILDLGFVVSDEDECIFFKHSPLTFISIYVDDGIIFSKSDDEIKKF